MFFGITLILSSCSNSSEQSSSRVETTTAANKESVIITAMFPGKDFSIEDNFYVYDADASNYTNGKNEDNYYGDSKESYYIENIIKGSFVNPDGKEYLVIVRRAEDEPTHAEGYYQVYLAVFNEPDNRILGETLFLAADRGDIRILSSKNLDFVFFTGETTYQGWETWQCGVWKAGLEWKKVWPENESYWNDLYPQVNDKGLDIFERKIIRREPNEPLESNGAPPDYVWQYSYSLKWNPIKARFE